MRAELRQSGAGGRPKNSNATILKARMHSKIAKMAIFQ
jgi:hypothetical protein